ncbi:MAG: aa3-type cytochrome c oxidase subunit IV [Sphingomonadales bacterium]|nr:aa3-type cytochrome c oxidase subunit IV [Sphingomonadales bacterium]RIK92951.1 MAG: aa3-type cytochrome c oxidase subunit IV [Pseudomonadota bacterium]
MTAQGHMDTTAHKEMYGNFLKLVKYSIAGTVVVLVVMALTLL